MQVICLSQASAALSYRLQGRFQFDEGWRQFADHWSLYSGEELHLQRRASPEGSGDAAIWLDVAVKRGAGSSVGELSGMAIRLRPLIL